MIVAKDEYAAFFSEAQPCILDSIRKIFKDFFTSVQVDDRFMDALLCLRNLSASQRDDPIIEAAIMDIDFAIALAKSYPGLANEIPGEEAKKLLKNFFGLIQPFISCIKDLTV
jgi:hypothetical protein